MHDTTMNWRGAYARLAGQLISADPQIGPEEIAERLAAPVDDLDRILEHHPLAPILQRWAQRAAGAWHRQGLARAHERLTL